MTKNYDQTSMMENIILDFSKTIRLFGLTSLEARLFSYLYLCTEPKTLDEMSEALGHSKTAISTNIRGLLDLNLVTRVWKKGVRKDLYEAKSHLFKAFMGFYMNKWKGTTQDQKENLEEMAKIVANMNENELETKDKTQLSYVEQQLQNMILFHEELLEAFHKVNNG